MSIQQSKEMLRWCLMDLFYYNNAYCLFINRSSSKSEKRGTKSVRPFRTAGRTINRLRLLFYRILVIDESTGASSGKTSFHSIASGWGPDSMQIRSKIVPPPTRIEKSKPTADCLVFENPALLDDRVNLSSSNRKRRKKKKIIKRTTAAAATRGGRPICRWGCDASFGPRHELPRHQLFIFCLVVDENISVKGRKKTARDFFNPHSVDDVCLANPTGRRC